MASISRGAAISSCTRAWPGPPCAWASGSRRWRCRCPSARCPRGRRLPRLSAHARDEREAAIALASRGLEAAATVAARFAVLDFGEVTLATRPGELDRAFARREMEEDEPGSRLLASAVAERRARARGAGRRLPLVAGAPGARGRARRADPGAARRRRRPGRSRARAKRVSWPKRSRGRRWAWCGIRGGCRCWRPWVWRSPTSGCGPWPVRRCWRSTTTRSASGRAFFPASASATPASPRSRRGRARPTSSPGDPSPATPRSRPRRAALRRDDSAEHGKNPGKF